MALHSLPPTPPPLAHIHPKLRAQCALQNPVGWLGREIVPHHQHAAIHDARGTLRAGVDALGVGK